MDLASENSKLKAEVEKLKAELAAARGAHAASPAAQAHPVSPPPKVIATDPEGHSAPAKESVPGLRLRPIFEGDKCVEIVAQVIPDLKKKRRKHKNKRHGVHSHAKGKNKKPSGPVKPPKIRAVVDASSIMQSYVQSDRLAALKRIVKDSVGKTVSIKEVSQGAKLEELLEEELKKVRSLECLFLIVLMCDFVCSNASRRSTW